ncbi:hypothetical protein ABPG72_010701 [Tetrahymena utriculariae]
MMKQNKVYTNLVDFINSSIDTHTHLHMDLSSYQIGDAGTSGLGFALAQCTNLSNLTLDLRKNQIGESGASGLGSGLAQCTNLSNLTLDLRENKIGESGASGLGSGLAQCTNLSNLELDLYENKIGDAGASGLGSGLAQCLNQMIKEEQQNILSQDKNNQKLNKIILTQNQLSHNQCEKFITNNQVEIKLNDQQQTKQERQNFYQSDSTLQKCLRSQIFKQAQNRLFSNAVCQIMNQEKKQSALISFSTNHCNPQDLNSKSQQSQQFIQTTITSQRENATITKKNLVQSYQQTVNQSSSILQVQKNNQKTSQEQIQQKQIESNELSFQITVFFHEMLDLLLKILKEIEKIQQPNGKINLQNSIHHVLLLVEQLQKLPLEIQKILKKLLSITEQAQKELIQPPKTETQLHDVAEQQLLNKQELPFPFQIKQLIKMFEEFYKIRETDKEQTEQFQKRPQIIQEKTEKIEQEIKDILKRFHKQVPENMQEQTVNTIRINFKNSKTTFNKTIMLKKLRATLVILTRYTV